MWGCTLTPVGLIVMLGHCLWCKQRSCKIKAPVELVICDRMAVWSWHHSSSDMCQLFNVVTTRCSRAQHSDLFETCSNAWTFLAMWTMLVLVEYIIFVSLSNAKPLKTTLNKNSNHYYACYYMPGMSWYIIWYVQFSLSDYWGAAWSF
jgi:hypothetical protein